MSRLSVFVAAAVLSALATIPAAFAKEHHHISIHRPSQGLRRFRLGLRRASAAGPLR
jgi:hypothetical protein